MKAATKVREIEKADYDTTHKDYSESIDALERAIAVLKKQAYTRAQASALIEVSSLRNLQLIPQDAKSAITAFLQQDPDEGLAISAPEAAGYEFQSSGIVEMLEKLLDKFISERTTLEKEEMNAHQAYKMLTMDLQAQVDQATAEKEAKATTKAKKLEAKANAQGDKKDTEATRKADSTYLADLVATCDQKASDFDARQELRAQELEAISKAMEIISSGAVAGSAEKHLPGLVQQPESLVQLRSESAQRQNQAEAARFLRSRATSLNSRVLSSIAQHAS